MLSENIFKIVIDSTPLLSLDFVVRNLGGKVLLGRRTNSPASEFWFVPGGRVLKNEILKQAYSRLLQSELAISDTKAKFLGVYQHFYADSFFAEDISTHYLVLAYELFFSGSIEKIPKEQHSGYRWFQVDELLVDPCVHEHTKAYFQSKQKADAEITS
jgi:colanic acid biosynthesis protein WcaH